jgi:hypothetical protein
MRPEDESAEKIRKQDGLPEPVGDQAKEPRGEYAKSDVANQVVHRSPPPVAERAPHYQLNQPARARPHL